MNKLKVHVSCPDQHQSVTHWVRIIKGFRAETAVSEQCHPSETPDVSVLRWGHGQFHPRAKLKLCIFWRDLHNMGAWFDVQELLAPEMLVLLEKAGYGEDDRAYFMDLRNQRVDELQCKPKMREQVPFDSYSYVAVPVLFPFTRHFVPRYGDKFLLMPHCVPYDIFGHPVVAARPLDIVTYGMMSRWYPARVLVHKALEKYCQVHQVNAHSDIYYFRMPIYKGYHREQIKAGHGEVVDHLHYRLAGVLQAAKMCFVDGSIENVLLAKYFEPMAAGCLLMGPMPREGELSGLVDGENMVVCDHTDIVEKVLYYLKHENQRRGIAAAGQKLVYRYHTIEARVTQVLSRIAHIVNGASVDEMNGPVDTWPTQPPQGWSI